MEIQTFKIGDVVTLKSGSPKMTVHKSYDDDTVVQYYNFETNTLSQPIKIPTGALKIVTETFEDNK